MKRKSKANQFYRLLGGLWQDCLMLFSVGLRPARQSPPFGVNATLSCFGLAYSLPDRSHHFGVNAILHFILVGLRKAR